MHTMRWPVHTSSLPFPSSFTLLFPLFLFALNSSMIANLRDLATVHRKMEGLGDVHRRHGVQAQEHMPVFRGVVLRLLGDALEGDLTAEVAEAWAWLWEWLTESMLVVERAGSEKASLIQASAPAPPARTACAYPRPPSRLAGPMHATGARRTSLTLTALARGLAAGRGGADGICEGLG